MNLLMRNYDKSIRFTDAIPIFQYDSLVDQLRILVPKFYEEFDLTEFDCNFTYVLPDETVHSVLLVLDEEPYNDDYLSYHLQITSDYTEQVGDITVELIFTKEMGEDIYSLATQTTKISIKEIERI